MESRSASAAFKALRPDGAFSLDLDNWISIAFSLLTSGLRAMVCFVVVFSVSVVGFADSFAADRALVILVVVEA